MSRNNEDRLGPQVPTGDVPPQIAEQFQAPQNTFSFIAPTEFVDLPSAGLYYPEDHPLYNEESVEIKHMTAKEEDILSDKTLLRKGLAIDRFLKSVIIDRRIKVDSLLVGDKNAILVAARITGYGPEYNTKVVCPVCFSHGRHEFDLNSMHIVSPSMEDYAEMGITVAEHETLVFGLPVSGFEVECRLMTGTEEKQIMAAAASSKKNNLPSKETTRNLKVMIVSVEGNTDRAYINSFVDNMPAKDSRYLRTTYQKCVPNIELKETHACGACQAETEISVPFTTDFFWPDT